MRSCPQPERLGGRWLRAAVFTALSTALAAAGHHLAAGDPVAWERVAGGAACAFALSWPLTRRPPPWWHVVTATGVGQLALHRALSVGRPVHHGHGGARGVVPHAVGAAHHGAWAMTAAHCAAVCVVALLMHRADQVLSRLPETVGRWAQKAVAAGAAAFGARCRPRPGPRPRIVPVAPGGPEVRPAVTTMLCDAVVRRGPPAGRAGDVPLIPAGRHRCGAARPRTERFPTVNTTTHARPVRRRLGLGAAGSLVILGLTAGPAAAHTEVTASDPRALSENVTLSFTAEAESDTAGISELRVVLPKGITPDAVTLKEAPEEWKLTATPDGYTVGGTALPKGTDAEYSITVRQLPDEKSLAFKTLETYGDGKVDRWIEVPTGGEKADNPAAVLELKAAAPGARQVAAGAAPTPGTVPSGPPSTAAPAASAAAHTEAADAKGTGGNTAAVLGAVAAVALLAAGAVWWLRRSRSRA
ncbi:nuclear export factor GLE1 [Actinobacteria bacterium OV450]|nr:nuclear export factor GLE1 [Actinobacteria bacterium OV450]